MKFECGCSSGACDTCGPVLPAIWPLVIKEMAGRDHLGRQRYGVPLQPHNGRDALRDAFEEALDLCAYLRQAIYERDGR